MEERYHRHSTIITSNLAYDEWRNFLGNQGDGGCTVEPGFATTPTPFISRARRCGTRNPKPGEASGGLSRRSERDRHEEL